MKKGLFSLFAAITLSTQVLAQDPEFTQFYANPLYLNPAFAGTARCPRLVMNYRNGSDWYDVHPLLRDVVDAHGAQSAAA